MNGEQNFSLRTRFCAIMELLQRTSSVADVALRFGVPDATVLRWLDQFLIGGMMATCGQHEVPPPGTISIDSIACSTGTLTVQGSFSEESNEVFKGLHAVITAQGAPAPSPPTGNPEHSGFPLSLSAGGSGTVHIWGVFDKTVTVLSPRAAGNFDCT